MNLWNKFKNKPRFDKAMLSIVLGIELSSIIYYGSMLLSRTIVGLVGLIIISTIACPLTLYAMWNED